ncbi:MAG: iron ABC transporter permease [Eubacteriaceae bacterium]|jgi:iron complex transport system permease protein|nr:iron ABC transporter permease [Eubacteriaceae bacterium]
MDLRGGCITEKDLRVKYAAYINKKNVFLLFLLIMLCITSIASLNIGSSNMTVGQSIMTLLGKGSKQFNHIVFNIRLPRVIGGLFVGMSMALSGMIIQSTLNNPLASPSTLGISNASAFGANIALIVFSTMGITSTPIVTSAVSFLAAMLCMILVIGISNIKGAGKTFVILAGVALNSLFAAAITVIQYLADETQLATAVSWTFGDLGRITYPQIKIVSATTLLSALVVYMMRWSYNAMDMGERTAHSIGVNTKNMRNISIFLAALNTGVSVAFVGMIGFVGLLAPQITKRVIGEDKRYMLPGTLLMGALVVILSDSMARSLWAPIVLPVGAITSFLGALLFLYILFKKR